MPRINIALRSAGAGKDGEAWLGDVPGEFLDDAEQPEDEDQDQNAAKTDIHGTLSCYWFCC
jgi:hypothetical protein